MRIIELRSLVEKLIMDLDPYFLKRKTIRTVNKILLGLLKRINRTKDRILSQKLFELAERYNTRPGEMNYHDLDGNYLGD